MPTVSIGDWLLAVRACVKQLNQWRTGDLQILDVPLLLDLPCLLHALLLRSARALRCPLTSLELAMVLPYKKESAQVHSVHGVLVSGLLLRGGVMNPSTGELELLPATSSSCLHSLPPVLLCPVAACVCTEDNASIRHFYSCPLNRQVCLSGSIPKSPQSQLCVDDAADDDTVANASTCAGKVHIKTQENEESLNLACIAVIAQAGLATGAKLQ
jgi:hypothetical protein